MTPFFVPETKRTAEMFEEMRKDGHQMALIVDEYGGLAGLVTLKRLSEEGRGSARRGGRSARGRVRKPRREHFPA